MQDYLRAGASRREDKASKSGPKGGGYGTIGGRH
jgi:hypothetical protein